jgi:hypothetical protein
MSNFCCFMQFESFNIHGKQVCVAQHIYSFIIYYFVTIDLYQTIQVLIFHFIRRLKLALFKSFNPAIIHKSSNSGRNSEFWTEYRFQKRNPVSPPDRLLEYSSSQKTPPCCSHIVIQVELLMVAFEANTPRRDKACVSTPFHCEVNGQIRKRTSTLCLCCKLAFLCWEFHGFYSWAEHENYLLRPKK